MAEAKHTPGPWSYSYEPQPNGCPIVGARGLMVAMLAHTVNMPQQRDEAIANARLIAAAPELAEEHQQWAAWFGEALVLALQGDYSKVDELAKSMKFTFDTGTAVLRSDVIAKATGERRMTESPRATPDQGSAELSDERIKEIAEAQGSWGASFGYTKESDFEKPFIPSHAYSFARAILATATRGEPSAEPAGYMEAFYEMAAMLGVEGAQAATPEQVYAEQVKPALERLQQRAEANEEAYLNMRDWAKMNGLDTTAYNATQPAPSVEPTDAQCDSVFQALHNWAMDVDPVDFGLPQCSGGGKEAAREVIRKALATATQPAPSEELASVSYPRAVYLLAHPPKLEAFVIAAEENANDYLTLNRELAELRATATQGAPTPAQTARTDLEWFRLPEVFGKFVDYAEKPVDENALRIIKICSVRATGIHPTPEQESPK